MAVLGDEGPYVDGVDPVPLDRLPTKHGRQELTHVAAPVLPRRWGEAASIPKMGIVFGDHRFPCEISGRRVRTDYAFLAEMSNQVPQGRVDVGARTSLRTLAGGECPHVGLVD
jgi:hypothetical protein